MWEGDEASRWLGMTCEMVRLEEAVVSMKLEAHHCNGHKTCHGGVSYALGDSAFAFACNSYNKVAVVLTAHAVERSRSGRSGIYACGLPTKTAI